jgi:hypothetical protein
MIPSRSLNGENFGNGVRYRVSACRRRLRVSRTIHRTISNIETDGQAREIESFPTLDENHKVFAVSGAEEEAEST